MVSRTFLLPNLTPVGQRSFTQHSWEEVATTRTATLLRLEEARLMLRGITGSIDFPTVNPLQPGHANNGNFDAFVSHFSASGTALVYSTYLGGTSGDEGHAIAVDSQGKVYLAGFPTPPTSPRQLLTSQPRGATGTHSSRRLTQMAVPWLFYLSRRE